MKIYFAGPLFTPYVRSFIAECAGKLRAHGFEVFVPHENSFGLIKTERLQSLLAQGILPVEEVNASSAHDVAMRMLKEGRLKREQLGLMPIDAKTVFDVDYGGLCGADAVFAILDGTQVDDGTACELGIFMGLMCSDPSKKGIVGLMTDSRGTRKKDKGFGLNLFIQGILEVHGVVFDTFEDSLQQLIRWDAELKAGL